MLHETSIEVSKANFKNTKLNKSVDMENELEEGDEDRTDQEEKELEHSSSRLNESDSSDENSETESRGS